MHSSNIVKILTLNDGNRMPAIGLGTAMTEPDDVHDVISNAIDIGYRYFDTAQLYKNHAEVGTAIANVLSSGRVKRQDLFITSKLAMFNSRPGDVTSSLIEWLKTMKLDYVDLFLIHHPAGLKIEAKGKPRDDREYNRFHETMNHAEVWKEMESLVSSGLTKSIGVSNFTKEQLTALLQHSTVKPAVIQNECHAYLQEKDLLKYCQDNNISFFAYAPLGSSGTINGKLSGFDILTDKVVCDIGRRYSKSPAQILLRFLVQKGVGVISGCYKTDWLKENINIFSFELADEDVEELLKLDCGKRVFYYPFMKKHPQNPYPDD